MIVVWWSWSIVKIGRESNKNVKIWNLIYRGISPPIAIDFENYVNASRLFCNTFEHILNVFVALG